MKTNLKIIVLTVFLGMLPFFSQSQTTVTIDTTGACPGDTLSVPVHVTGFNNVAAISLIISYNPAVITYIGLDNIHSQILGTMGNAVSVPNDEIRIGWFSASSGTANIGTGVLFNIQLIYHGGENDLVFHPFCELADNLYNSILTTYNNGKIEAGATPVITTQPSSIKACTGTPVTFGLTSGNTLSWEWEMNDGTGWTTIPSGTPYTGNLTDSLDITPINSAMDQYLFRCHLTNLCHLYSDPVSLQVSNPQVSAGADDTICIGQQATLNAINTGGISPYNYQWGAAGQGASIMVSPSTTTQYTVTLTDSLGCITTDDVTVVVSNPVTDVGNGDTICLGGTATLNGTTNGGIAPYTYQWQHGGNMAQTNVSPTFGQYYHLQVTDFAGCLSYDSAYIEVSAPGVDAGNDDTICITFNSNLSANVTGGFPPYQYQWSNMSTNAQQTVSPTVTTTYTISVTDKFSCLTTDDVVLVVSHPITDLGNDDTLCFGASTTLDAATTGGITPYNYAWSTTATSPAVQVTPSTQTLYQVTVTDAKGCISTDDITLLVSDPSVEAGPNDTLCNGSQTTLSATGSAGYTPYSYSWSGGGSSATYQVSPTASTWYEVTLTDIAGCQAIDSLHIMVSSPTVTVGNNDSICLGDQTTITAVPSGGIGTYQYLWSTAASQNAITVSPSTNTTYTVTITDVANCQATTGKTILVSQPIAIAGNNIAVCHGVPVTFTGGASGGFTPYNYTWNGIPGQTLNLTATLSGNQILSVMDILGCTDTDTTILTVHPNPMLSISPDDTVCYNTPASITTNVTGGTGTMQYLWSNNATTTTISPVMLQNTTYWVKVTDINGCFDSTGVNILVSDPFVNIGNDDTLCAGESLLLDGTATGGFAPYTHQWNTGATTPTTSIMATNDTTVKVVVTDAIGCIANDSVVLMVSHIAVDAGADVVQCPNATLNLNAIATGGIGLITYLWSTGDINPATTAVPFTDSTFVIEVEDMAGCLASDTMEVTMHPLPMPNLGPDDTICINHTTTLDPGAGFASYVWSTGAISPTLFLDGAVLGTGTFQYSVTVTNQFFCENADTMTLVVDPCIGIEPGPENQQFITLYPNPAKEMVYLTIPESGEGTISLYNSSGDMVIHEEFKMNGSEIYQIATHHLSPGLYMVLVHTATGTSSVKLVIK